LLDTLYEILSYILPALLPEMHTNCKGVSPMNTQKHVPARNIDTAHPVVFYDGDCPLCRREIDHYRRMDSANRLHWVDAVNEPGILAEHGLSLERAMTELHVLDAAGHWQRGINAFLVIWQHLPPYRWLAKLVTNLGLRRPLGFVYRRFAAWRYRQRCETGSCTTSAGGRRR
jgi:predicted DCC family thiol-disulfide oxidoreductase YuxK